MILTKFIHALLDATTFVGDMGPEIIILINGEQYSVSSVHEGDHSDIIIVEVV